MSEIPDLERARDLAYSVNSGVYQHQKNCADALLDVLAYVAQLQEALREVLDVVSMDADGFVRANLGSEADLARFDALLPVSLDEANQQGPG